MQALGLPQKVVARVHQERRRPPCTNAVLKGQAQDLRREGDAPRVQHVERDLDRRLKALLI
jgi:hypothetical protein